MILTKIPRALVVSLLLLWPALSGASAAPPPGRALTAIEHLGLSRDQKAKLRGFVSASKLRTRKDRGAIVAERRRQMDLYCDYNLNLSQARDSIAKINRLQLDLLNRRLERRLRIRSVLTYDQFVKFRQLMAQMPRSSNRIEEELPPGAAPRGRLPRLDLRSSQQQQIQEMWESQRTAYQKVIRSMTADLQSVDQLYASYRVDQRAAKGLIASINKSQLRVSQLRLDRQIELRKILNESQFKTLAAHTKSSFGPPPPPGRGPRDR